YPVEGNNTIRRAPDAMVAIGRPKGYRGSYQQWLEENIAPQVVFEVLSPGNRPAEMSQKLDFYQRYGVEEYYIYNPDRVELSGYVRQQQNLIPVKPINDWTSPLLGITFQIKNQQLQILRPDNQPFLTFLELDSLRLEAEIRAGNAELRAENAELRVKNAELRADNAELRADNAELKAEQERQRAEKLISYLRSQGINADEI
ncbi:MAG: Uma2 family endonuclease, partial [Microcystaceae cyanobacterium]